ncbi:YbaB/EbfC family nucleoid-associated protein [Streptomyces sp. NPDC090080]|uniref:YbaB/EbfC family nucleoid-associated protein n=1 Tax=Streptomyces sp. NPDC090080 TaxID=3365939 RepID=UPI0038216BC3
MDEEIEHHMEELVSSFLKERDLLVQMRSQLEEMTVTASSSDRVVEVTVGGRGETASLRFPGNKHQKMNGQQLAKSILEAEYLARKQLLSRIESAFSDLPGPHGLAGSGEGLLDANFDDLVKMFSDFSKDSHNARSEEL